MTNLHAPPGQPRPGVGPHPFDLLAHMMAATPGANGDVVFSQQEFDRVLTQLMEQNAGSNAPGPASDEAIQALPTRKVDKDMMGSDGKAECSICMDSVEIGEEVTSLPCKHWFHGQCVSAWLKEHDTCPHCRQGITRPPEDTNQRSQSVQPEPSLRRSPRRRSSSVTSPRASQRRNTGVESNRRVPGQFPENPRDLRSARQHYYESRPGDFERRQSQRPADFDERHRRDSGRNDNGNSNSGSTGGTVGDWLRNHLPFQ